MASGTHDRNGLRLAREKWEVRIKILVCLIVDLLAGYALLSSGIALQLGHLLSFAGAACLYWLLISRTFQRRTYLQWSLVSLAALFLRAGVLALLIRTSFSSPMGALGLAAIAGWCVMAVAETREQSWRTAAAAALVYCFALRLLYAGSVELLPEETYYWNYAQHLDIGYLDHPPMVAWLISLGTTLFGQTEFGVRFGALCCGVVTATFVYHFTRNLMSETRGRAVMALTQSLPFFFLSGMLMTPDAPLTAAWAATLYFLERALIGGRANAWWGVGIALGLGLLSKYTILLLAPVTFGFMLWDPQARLWWRRPHPYAAALLALCIFSPVLWWNAEHEWASFAFQTSRRLADAPRFSLHKLVASALILITPTGVVALTLQAIKNRAALRRSSANSQDDLRRFHFLTLSILFPLAVFTVFSLRHEVKLDWTGAPWTAALPVLAGAMLVGESVHGFALQIRRTWTVTLVSVLTCLSTGLLYLAWGLPGAGYSAHIELIPVGWRDLGAKAAAAADSLKLESSGDDPILVGMDRYALASELAFYARKAGQPARYTSSAHLFGGEGLMYARWAPAAALAGRTLLLTAFDARDLQSAAITSRVERLGAISSYPLIRDGKIIRLIYQRAAYGYHSEPTP